MITLTLSLTTLPSVTYKNERKGDSSDIEKRATAPHLPTAFTLSWSGLTYEVNGCTILSDVSGELRSGQMYAVMGPSGAGKSTFLNVLCKRVDEVLRSVYPKP